MNSPQNTKNENTNLLSTCESGHDLREPDAYIVSRTGRTCRACVLADPKRGRKLKDDSALRML